MGRQSLPSEPNSAQTNRTGFLHLPNEIRNRICELVLLQHDGGAVFLPRKLPRKVLEDGSKILDEFSDLESTCRNPDALILTSDTALSELLWNVQEDGHWVEGERPPEESPLPIFTEEETDDEPEVRVWIPGSYDKWQKAWIGTRDIAKDRESGIEAADVCSDCELVYCACIEEALPSAEEAYDAVVEAHDLKGIYEGEPDDAPDEAPDDVADDIPDDIPDDGLDDGLNDAPDDPDTDHESDEDEDEDEERYDSDGLLIPPTRCINGHGGYGSADNSCHFCGGVSLGPGQDEEAYIDDDSDHDDLLEEDDEHFDSEERTGMLFRTSEPGILQPCKEIREQCVPVYYGSNAFSWRFFWGHQTRSLARFTEWTTVVGKNAKYIAKISFEGRHDIEEGIEFEVDIDLLEHAPFFDVAADCIHPGDELTDVIVEAIEQEFITILWRMSKRDRGVITLSSKDLCLLGTIFSEALQRDPGIVGDRGQWDGKYAVVPRGA